jgi:ribonuclease BN (tRNA processing enzyme)
MSPPSFPIGPDGLKGDWRFHGPQPGCRQIEGYAVTFAEVVHRGGLTYGIRVEADGVSLAYVPDHAPAGGSGPAQALAAGVDVLLHDAQFLEPEREMAHAYGHATVDEAIEVARRSGARRLVLTHHAPGRTDDELDKIAAEVADRDAPTVEVARQGDVLSVTR